MRAVAAILGLLLTACVGGRVDAGERERLASLVLDAAPASLPHRLDVDFDGKVALLGYHLDPEGPVRSGQRVKLTLYWQAHVAPGAGWSLFTHLLDGSGERLANLDHIGPLRQWKDRRQSLGPWAWKAGKVYVDEQEFTVPETVRTRRLQLVTGLWKGEGRMPIRSGPHDEESRAIVTELEVVRTGAVQVRSTRVPRLRVDRLPPGVTIRLDGHLDEEAWRSAAFTGPFRDVATGEANQRQHLGGSARVLWDDAHLYLGLTIDDHDVVGGFPAGSLDPQLWTRDTAEVMLDPDGDGDNRDYYELQINPQNLSFDSRFDRYNLPRVEPNGPFGHQAWSSLVESAVHVRGTLDRSGDQDQGYTVEARIPWRAFDRAAHVPPRVGDEWRMNFYAMERNDGVAWSPILGQGNFHKASRFGRVLWAEPGWVEPGAAISSQPSAAVVSPQPSAAAVSPRPSAAAPAGSARQPTTR